MDDEERQVQLIVNAAQATTNDLSLAGKHLAATNVSALIQLARVLWTRLHPPVAEAPPEAPAKEPRHLESV
jgi:hypothetical protein